LVAYFEAAPESHCAPAGGVVAGGAVDVVGDDSLGLGVVLLGLGEVVLGLGESLVVEGEGVAVTVGVIVTVGVTVTAGAVTVVVGTPGVTVTTGAVTVVGETVTVGVTVTVAVATGVALVVVVGDAPPRVPASRFANFTVAVDCHTEGTTPAEGYEPATVRFATSVPFQ
jgi:hypothetical protein